MRFLRRAHGGAFLFSWQKDLFLQGKMGRTPVWHIRKAYLLPDTMDAQHRRLASLDILRGFDLFLLVFLQPVACAVLWQIDAPAAKAILYQLDHEAWAGFRAWDLVMPLFLFISGTSIPFSFGKMLAGGGKAAVYRKVVKRFFLLFLLGMVVQGNLLGFDPHNIYIYTNTLQAIAAGYLITALIVLNCKLKGQIIAAALLLAGYTVPMMLLGDYTPEANFALRLDALVLGRFQGDPSYSWILSSLTFGVTVLFGAFAGQIIKNGKDHPSKAALRLLVIGIALVAAGLLWSLEMPIIKRIWTGSMTLFSGGLCFLLMWLFYWWIDIKGHSRGLNWLKIYGMNSIAAYMIGEVVNFRSAVQSVSYGLAPLLGDFYEAWLTFGNFAIVFTLLLAMYRCGVFLKV